MLLTRSQFQILVISIVCFVGVIVLSTQIAQARSLTFKVNCQAPDPGTYSLGWGTSRLIIPEQGQPYRTFRGKTSPNTDTLCKAGDNVGVVAFRKDGTVWGHMRVAD